MTTFAIDLFISYAHIDNQSFTAEQGWVTRFHATLEADLSMLIGGKARIWRDDKLQGNDVFAAEIVDQFAQTAVLVSVLTPRYLNSDWCAREVAEFCKSAEQSGGVVVENKARIFKVLKTPVDTEESLPSVIKDLLGYEFFAFEDGAPLELDSAYGEKLGEAYRRKVRKLAWDIKKLLKKLGTESSESGQLDQATAKTMIYLAECSYDQKDTREILVGELERHGYAILPDQQLPQDEKAYVAVVERLLERCTLAIHLVGESYGAVPDGPSQKSRVVLQNELAAKSCRSGALQRVIWLPDGTHSKQAPQQAFIEALHQDAEIQFGADLMTGDFEELKAEIHATLKKQEKPKPKTLGDKAISADGSKLIYLICDEKDRKATVPLRKFCKTQGFEIHLPAFEGDATSVRKANQQLLTSCDAVILFYGAGDEAWKRTIDSELKKMSSYRSGKPVMASHTYLAAPKTNDKEDLIDMEEPGLINGLKDFSEAAMAVFVQALKSNGAAP